LLFLQLEDATRELPKGWLRVRRSFTEGGVMRSYPLAVLLASAGALLSACDERSATGIADRPSFSVANQPGIGARDVTVDFASFGADKVFEPDFYRSDGILFPPEECGSAGCFSWFIGFCQGHAALAGQTSFGPVEANFTRPVSGLSLLVTPALQGTATYVLTVFAASGEILATTSVTVTQDLGDPANSGSGYFTISLTNLPGPARSFTLDNVFVRSSFPSNTMIPYCVSSISYTHWGAQP